MEEQKERIGTHLQPLVASTVWSKPLLEHFLEQGLLSFLDKQIIESKKTAAGKTAEFYRLIQSRANAYPVLIEGLQKMGQADAAMILEKGVLPPGLEGKTMPKLIVQNQLFEVRGGGGATEADEKATISEPSSAHRGPQELEEPGNKTQDVTRHYGMRKRMTTSKYFKGGASPSSPDGTVKGSEVSKDSNSGGHMPVHPLLIEEILDIVFQYMGYSNTNHLKPEYGCLKREAVVKCAEMQNLRLVCRTWRDVITPHYRRTLGATRLGQSPRKDRADFGSTQEAILDNMQKFVNIMKSSSMISVQSYWIFENALVHGKEQVMEDFLRICGPETVNLRIWADDSYTDKYNLNQTNMPDLNLKKLKVLDVDLRNFKPQKSPSRKHGFADFVELLVNTAKGLQKLKVHFDYPFGDKDREQVKRRIPIVMQQVEEALCGRIPKTVTSLQLRMTLREITFTSLIGLGLKLEKFDCSDDHSFTIAGGETTRRFLESQAATLKVLRISKFTSEGMEFPILGELEELELRNSQFIKPFCFAETFPKLRCLDTCIWQSDDPNSFLRLFSWAEKTAPSVKVIYLPEWFDLTWPTMCLSSRARKCFPNAYQEFCN